jgi:heat shock protein HslJ
LTQFNTTTIDASQVYTISFEGELGTKMNAKFCNNMGGQYSVVQGVLKANLVTTEMACVKPENLMLIENTFGSMLVDGARMTVNGDTLTLVDSLKNIMVFNVYLD